MMTTPEQHAELQAKTLPLLEKLVETLNALNDLGDGQPVVAANGKIMAPGGSVVYRRCHAQWEIGDQR